LRLDITEVGGEEENSEKENVVERDAGLRRPFPAERCCTPHDVPEADGRRETDARRDDGGADPVVVLLHEEADARGDEENAGVQERPELEPNRDELPPGHAEQLRRRWVSENPLCAKGPDRLHHLGLHVDASFYRVSIPSAIVTRSVCFTFVFPKVSVTV
jgi:hypothetical protein